MKKKLILLVALLTTTFTHAESYDPSEFCPPHTCAYNAPYNPDIRCAWDLFVNGKFLYWRAQEDNLEPFTLFIEDNSGNILTPNALGNKSYKIGKLDFDYKPAFKAGLGVHFDCDNWELYGEYTWYHHTTDQLGTTTTLNTTTQVANNYYPRFALNFADDILDYDSSNTQEARWKMKLNMGDLSLARQYFVGQFLTFKTQYGLRAAWISQNYFSKWTGRSETSSAGDTLIYTTRHKTNSWGIGPKAELNTSWHFCGGFRIFTDASAALLYTEYTIRAKEDQLTSVPGTNTDQATTSTTIERCKTSCLRPHALLGLGLGYGDYFCSSKWHFDLAVGYDFNIFWNQNMFAIMTDIGNRSQPKFPNGDLYLHGLTVQLTLDF